MTKFENEVGSFCSISPDWVRHCIEMRSKLEGIIGESAVSRAVSDRPELTTPAFQFLLPAGGDAYAPLTEGVPDFGTIELTIKWYKTR